MCCSETSGAHPTIRAAWVFTLVPCVIHFTLAKLPCPPEEDFNQLKETMSKDCQHYSPTGDISGTEPRKGPPINCGGLSLMSCTLMMNCDGDSRDWLESLLMTRAMSVYSAFSSLSSLFIAWMSPVFSLMTKIVPAPSPDSSYLRFLSATFKSVWSWERKREKKIRWVSTPVHYCFS